MSASECVNRLVCDFFRKLRNELHDERMLLQGRDERQRAMLEELHLQGNKEEIARRFGISQAYFKSLRQMHRKVSLDDYVGVIRWLQSHVAECHREEVSRLVKDLLPI